MRLSTFFAGLAAVAAVACGGSDDGGKGSAGPGKVDSGVPASKPANELTDAEVQSLCKSLGEAASLAFDSGQGKQAMCGFSAYFLASFVPGDNQGEVCSMAYDECLKQPAEVTQEECDKPSSSCTATIGEIETCYNDSLAQVQEMLNVLPGCDDVGTEYEEPATGNDASPASCKVVQEKCPEALDDVPTPLSAMGG